jgi:hypothetical protein
MPTTNTLARELQYYLYNRIAGWLRDIDVDDEELLNQADAWRNLKYHSVMGTPGR